ncbi:RICIN domain-containing protein [Streptomyces sp. NPDC088554]|uniref:RICIN domain-containing protein n=1 Tax=Streptomyces sp. NPDC088554 TaxID=3365865 RepID=UPI00382AF591
MHTPHSPHPPRPLYPPRSAAVSEASDAVLVAALRMYPDSGDAYPVAVLMARHWQPVRDYAAVALGSSANTASVLAATAFHQVLESRQTVEPIAALRPRLLVAVRDLVQTWSSAQPICALLPELRRAARARTVRGILLGTEGRAGAGKAGPGKSGSGKSGSGKPEVPADRKLAARSFLALSSTAQCLLWHIDAEGEHISVPAVLLALDTVTARSQLQQAREQFRAGCLLAHAELATNEECRHYSRLLDEPIRRGGALLPDVRKHLAQCSHCRFAAEQLGYFNGELDVLLAEVVLGRDAPDYLGSRRGDRTAAPVSSVPRSVSSAKSARSAVRAAGRHSVAAPAGNALGAGRRGQSKALLTGIGVGSVALLATVAVTSLWALGGDDVGSAVPSGSYGTPPFSGSRAAQSSGALSGDPIRTQLRNVSSDLCLDIRGAKADTKARPGARATMAACSSAATQQWSYEDDGLLRSLAEPKLCLNSRADDGVIVLDGCTEGTAARATDVRYDLTVHGKLVPQRRAGLSLAPVSSAAGADVVVRTRDGSREQRWLTEALPPPPTSSAAPNLAPASSAVR